MKLSSKRIKKALISLRECAGWSAPFCSQTPKTGFVMIRPIYEPPDKPTKSMGVVGTSRSYFGDLDPILKVNVGDVLCWL